MADRPRYLSVPYGRGELEFMLQAHFDLDVLESGTATPIDDLPAETVRRLESPLGSPRLRDLAAEAVRRVAPRPARAVIAVTDLTRGSPDAILVPPLLDELNAGGIGDAQITVIVALGLHRATTDAEKREKLGGLVDRVRVVDSDGRDPTKWADLGPIPRRAGLRFCLNVVTDDRERVITVVAGDPDAVLAECVAKAAALYTRPIAKQYDIAIAGVGHPKDTNLYQASRAATYLRFAPTPVVREGGAIIIPARLDEGAGEGAGEQRFLAALERAPSPAAVVDEARRHFAGGEQRAVMVALTLQWCQIIVAASESPEVVRLAKLRAAVDVEEALDIAYEHIRRPARASVLLVPRALHTLPIVQSGVTA